MRDSGLAYPELSLEQLTERLLRQVGRTGAPVTEHSASQVRGKVDHISNQSGTAETFICFRLLEVKEMKAFFIQKNNFIKYTESSERNLSL